MAKSVVFVEINPETGKIIRIFKNVHLALSFPQEIVKQSLKSYAVGEIRAQIVKRATNDEGIVKCEWCSKTLPGEYLDWGQKGHMHEVLSKGKQGEVSVSNGVMICVSCHLGPDGAHGDRKWGGRS